MHKNQLQELAQRSGYNLPSYSCIREGPDHAPKFKATVTFNGETFSSPGYFASLRQAEHAAAEVALKVFSQRSPSQPSIAKILDESGVCKNLLQETAQRANVPLPNYNTVRSGPGHLPVFTCTVEVAGLQFIGEAARTKKQAEKNAALSAWAALKRRKYGQDPVFLSVFPFRMYLHPIPFCLGCAFFLLQYMLSLSCLASFFLPSDAGRNQSTFQEDSDVTDEQEQSLIARALANAYTANAIKSSPAVLSHAEAAARGLSFVIPNPVSVPKGMASAPLYTRNRTAMPGQQQQNQPPQQSAGPLYVPRHANPTWSRANESLAGQTSAAPMTRPAHLRDVTISEVTEAEAQAIEAAAAVAAAAASGMGYRGGYNSQIGYGEMMVAPHVASFPRLTHSSPMVDAAAAAAAPGAPRSAAPGPSYVRRTSAAVGSSLPPAGTANIINKSVPNFPTQTLVSQTIPAQPGVGIPNAMPVNSGMAYQPRVPRASTTSKVNQGYGQGSIALPMYKAGTASRGMYPAASSMDDALAAALPADLDLGTDAYLSGGPSIAVDSRSSDIWSAGDRELSPNSYWRAANKPGGNFGAVQPRPMQKQGVQINLSTSVVDDSGKPCRVLLEEDDEVEATARQMLNHLCL